MATVTACCWLFHDAVSPSTHSCTTEPSALIRSPDLIQTGPSCVAPLEHSWCGICNTPVPRARCWPFTSCYLSPVCDKHCDRHSSYCLAVQRTHSSAQQEPGEAALRADSQASSSSTAGLVIILMARMVTCKTEKLSDQPVKLCLSHAFCLLACKGTLALRCSIVHAQ